MHPILIIQWGLTHFCHQTPLLKRRWQLQRLFEQGNKHFVLALALNRVGMHNKRTCVLYPKMHASCSFLSLVMITAISMHASLVKLPCKGIQTLAIFKNARQESPNTRVCELFHRQYHMKHQYPKLIVIAMVL